MDMIKLKITGTHALLMHADTLADPLNPLTKAHKELTAKKKKTDEDHYAIALGDWALALYIDDQGPYIPGINIFSSLVSGGALSKHGTNIKRSVEIKDDRCHLHYDGPRTREGLWEAKFYDVRGVKVGQKKVMRYRPIFHKGWFFFCELWYDAQSIDVQTVISSMKDAGQYIGLGDYRPKFGRFTVEEA
jgi:hypothetical protein